MLNKDYLTFKDLTVKFCDSLLIAFWAVVDVSLLLVADEGKCANLTILLALFVEGNER